MSEAPPAPFRLEVDSDNIVWLIFDTPGSRANVLGAPALDSLQNCLTELESRIATGYPVAVVLWSAKRDSFIVGADIKEIAAVDDAEDGREKSAQVQRVFRRLEQLAVPTIAAIDGICLGGGAELALACDWRIGSDSPRTRLGLPEVRLGLIPGFGGSVRLPRLIGMRRSLSMILTAKSISAKTALDYGLLDRMLPAEGFRTAVAATVADIVLRRITPGEPRRSLWDRLLEGTTYGRHLIFSKARARVEETSGGHYPAPMTAIDVVAESIQLPLEDALAREAEAAGRLAATSVCKNLVRVFNLGQAAKKALPAEVAGEAVEVGKVAVIGAGVMGGGIAELLAAHDIPVILKDIDPRALDAGLRHANDLLRQAAKRGIFSAAAARRKAALIQGTLAYDSFEDVDFVIEAIIERLPVKKVVLREAEQALPEHAVFATNTSALSVTKLSAGSGRPGQVVGMHFFNPVHKMPLVEIIRTDTSSTAAAATAFRLAKRLGKTPVLVADRTGFIVNRLLAPYLNEAGFLLEDGADVAEIDGALTEFGMPMGPCRLLDEVGFDIVEHVAQEMVRAFGERMRPSRALGILTSEGRLGKKNKRGFYSYSRRGASVDRNTVRSLSFGAAAAGSVAPDDIVDRCLLPSVNEAMHALEDGVASGAGDVDLAMVMGAGFPPFRGGMLAWADRRGAGAVRDRLIELQERHGERFAPAPALNRAADEGGALAAV